MKIVLPLNRLKIRNLKLKLVPYRVFDGNGLYLEILPSGTKSWRLKYRINNREKKVSFVKWPAISLRKARELAINYKKSVNNDEITVKSQTV
jgi:hypothetical protein